MINKEYKKTIININNGEDIISISEFGSKSRITEEIEGYKMQTGEHMICKSTLNIINVKKYKVIHCHSCGLRLKFPVEIEDGESLKEYFEKV